jgi:choline dehydrogenase-like flavoprotein
MRHFVDLYLLAFPEGPGRGDKAIAFNDFYHSSGTKLGTVQSFGLLPPPAMLTATIESDLRRGRTPWLAGLFRPAEPFARLLLDHLLAGKTILTSIVEDLPWRENRIELSASGGVLHYRIPPYDRERIAAMRLLVRQALKPRPLRLLRQAENNERIAHACGTCRFGNDPRESVLDADNRAHGIENLYVVDASFFPTSGGTNPALTIAANAVRVAERILGRPILRSGGEHVHM